MDYLPAWVKAVLWISVGGVLVYAFVSSRRYKIPVNDRRASEPDYVAGKILSALQDKQARHGNNDWVDPFELGKGLGFSIPQIRSALAEFESDEHIDVVVNTGNRIKLGVRGQMMRRPRGSS
jgi:hypothetical protein